MAVKTRVIQVMGTLGKVLGPGTKKHKELMVLLFPLLGDGKKTIQTQVSVGCSRCGLSNTESIAGSLVKTLYVIYIELE